MRQVDMSDMVHLLWFVKEMPEGEDDIELLIGVYSSDEAARAAIERMEEKPGFADFPQGFEVCPYPLDRDYWTEDFVVERQPLPAAIRHAHAEFACPQSYCRANA